MSVSSIPPNGQQDLFKDVSTSSDKEPPKARKLIDKTKGCFRLMRRVFGFKRKFKQRNFVGSDVKAEITPMITRTLKKLGYRLIILNPGNLYTDKLGPPANINPFEMAVTAYRSKDPNIRKRTMSFINEMMEVFVPLIEEGNDNKFFRYGGFDVCKAVLIYLILTDPDRATPAHVFRIMADADKTRRCLRKLRNMVPTCDEDTGFINDAHALAKDLLQTDKAKTSYLPTFIRGAMPKLSIFGQSGLLGDQGEYATTKLADVRTNERVALLIMTPMDQTEYLAPYTALIFINLFQAIQIYGNGHKIHFSIDEAPSAAIPKLGKYLNMARSAGCTVELLGQSDAAFEQAYGENEYKQMRPNFGVQTYGAPNTYEEAKALSDYFGMKVEKTYSGNAQNLRFDDVGVNVSETEVPIFTPQELLGMKRNQMVVKISGLQPFIIERIPWWKIGGLKQALDDNPIEGKAPWVWRYRMKIRFTKNGVKLIKPDPRKRPREDGEIKKFKTPLIRFRYFLWLYTWMAILAAPYVAGGMNGPYIFYSNIYSSTGSGTKTGCRYIAPNGDKVALFVDYCPLILLENPHE